MKNKLFTFTAFLFFVPFLIHAQEQIKGIVANEAGERVVYAVVSEILVDNGRLVSSTLSDSVGQFRIIPAQQESFLYVTCLGYKPQKVLMQKKMPDLTIILDADTAIALTEVEIVAQKPMIKVLSDRLVYDFSSNPLKNSNILDAFKFVPLLQATNDGFSIIGKENSEIYINGRKSNLTQNALIAYLKTLSTDQVKNIEVITTPSATFRGEGNFGIINIELKKNEADGLNGTFFGQLWKTHYFKERGSLSLNYQRNKLATNFTIGITNSSDWKKNSVETVYKQNELNTSTNTLTDGSNLAYFAGLTADYKLNDKQTLGFLVNASLDDGNWTETGITKFVDLDLNQTDSILGLQYKSKTYNPEIAVNANYRIKFDEDKQYLFVDIDYLNNYNKQESMNTMNYLDEKEEITSIYNNFEQIAPQKSAVWSGKVEYGNNLNPQLNFKLGVDMYHSTINNDDKYRIQENGISKIDTLKSNHFEIKEWTPAFFMHIHKEWSKKISTSLGSRFEYTTYEGIQHTTNEHFKNNYFNFLPVLYTSYEPSGNHKLNYNLSYRIIRPSFRHLNPFVTYTSPTSYSKGNPYLNPAKRISHNLQYMLLNRYYFMMSYNETKDIINGIETIKENNMIESKPINLSKERNFSALFNTSFKYLSDNAALDFNLSYNWVQVRGSTEGLNLGYSINSFNLYLNNYYQISKRHDLSFDCGINYGTKQKYSNIESPSYLDFNAQLRKKINNWQLSLYCRTSTYLYGNKWTNKWKLIYDTEDLQKITYKWGEAISFGLKVSYNFGNTKVKGVKKRKTSNSEVKSRVN